MSRPEDRDDRFFSGCGGTMLQCRNKKESPIFIYQHLPSIRLGRRRRNDQKRRQGGLDNPESV